MRCDANVSVRRSGDSFGVRCEIKNLNSLKSIVIGLSTQFRDLVTGSYACYFAPKASEARRQIWILEHGGQVQQETRGFDEDSAETFKLRSKEDAPDYRYMPDPNLAPLILSQVSTVHHLQAKV